MIHVFDAFAEVMARCDPGEGLELVNEMGLVEIAGLQCQICPIGLLPAKQGIENTLEALHPVKLLRRESHIAAEQLDKAGSGVAALLLQAVEAGLAGCPAQLFDGIADEWPGFPYIFKTRMQLSFHEAFKGMKTCPRRFCLQQLLPEKIAFHSPQGVQGYALVPDFRQGKGKERAGTAGFEHDTQAGNDRCRVDYQVIHVCAGNDR